MTMLKGLGLSEGRVGKHRIDKVFDRTLTGHHGLTNMDDVCGALANAISGCPLPCWATANHHQFVLQVWHAQLSPTPYPRLGHLVRRESPLPRVPMCQQGREAG